MEDVFKTTERGSRHDVLGQEHLNPTPMQPPVGYKPQPSLIETIREQVRAYHLLQQDAEIDTEDEADDFDIDDDPVDPHSQWENDHIPTLKEARERLRFLEEEEKNYLSQADAKNLRKDASPGATPPQRSGGGEELGASLGEPPSTSASK